MNSRAAEWRPGPSVCRCCLTEGCYKDISTEYFWMGRREVYEEMLSETFDISIAYSKSPGPNSHSRLICEACIARLRDASNFKRQVRDCERTFLQHLDPASSSSIPSLDDIAEPLGKTVKIEESDEVKAEHLASDDDMMDDLPDFGDDDDDDDDLDNQPLTRLARKTPKKEDVDITDLLDNAKAALKRRSTTKAKSSPAKKAKPAKKEKEKVAAKEPKPPKKKKGEAPHCMARRNAKTLISYTTAYPFRLPHSALVCVYCRESFPDSAEFRKHMDAEHKICFVKAAFGHLMPEQYLKVDITDLKCRICKRSFETLDDVSHHLNDSHIHKIDLNYEFGLQPFRFSENRMTCVICEQNFSGIRMLSRHMSSHFSKYECKECGNKFSTADSLSHHTLFAHSLGSIICRTCKRSFNSLDERREHLETSEKCLKYKCSYCPMRFFNYDTKQDHQSEVHGENKKEEYPCLECNLVFKCRKAYSRHYSNVHSGACLDCPICGRSFNTKKHLQRHGIVHSKRKDHQCNLCGKAFASKDYLKVHIRSHLNKHKST